MNIALMIHTLGSGGAETLVRDLAVEYRRMGNNVTIILLDEYLNSEYEKHNIDYLRSHSVDIVNLGRVPGTVGIFSLLKLLKHLRNFRYDILHSHLTLTILFSSLATMNHSYRPVRIATFHSTNLQSKYSVSIVDYIFNKTQVLVFCSYEAYNRNSRRFSNSYIIENGILFRNYNLYEKGNSNYLSNNNQESVLISVGRVSAPKNYMTLIKAVYELKNMGIICQCVICGKYSETYNSYSNEIAKLGIDDNVKFFGERTDVPTLLNKSDIYVSTSKWEGLPIAVLEALSSGIPCVLSPIREHLIFSDIFACKIATENTPISIARTIADMLERNFDREEIKKRRKNALEKYSIETCARKYFDLYKTHIRHNQYS